RPFVEKRDLEGGFADSPLRLNKGLGKLNQWNAKHIQDRSKKLSDIATSVWDYPNVSSDVLRAYNKPKNKRSGNGYTLNDFPELTGQMLDLFQELRKRIKNLDSSVNEEFKKLYIAYKTTTNFVD